MRVLAVSGAAVTMLLASGAQAGAVPGADLGVAVSGPARAAAGAPMTYAMTVWNTGPVASRAVAATFALPRGFAVIGLDAPSCTDRSRAVRCTFRDLAAGAARTVRLQGVIAPEARGPLHASARVRSATADPSRDNDTAAVTTPLTPGTDMAVRLTTPRRTAARGARTPLTAVVANRGGATARRVTLYLGAHGAHLLTSPADRCAATRASGRDQYLRCDLGTLTPGTSRTVRTATQTGGGAQRFAASVTSAAGETAPADNTATAHLTSGPRTR
ncbi:DUF11 domain-containing protein [Actinomadura parmotrematis]|uniref:DUF11 domain-containing protein n=1 Tax=Actinomadura parmotrematis TaxID=2864039 RepID=A0ABS7G4Y9_9ACTN|nr:DUF11 domain-containing protein [Actinomadura parmotrematis]MBW8486924.1 DUF11 domain-containing protein [Actinomadura parmotrematis]